MTIRSALILAMTSAALFGASAIGVAQQAVAQEQGTREERAACRADSRRFCRAVDPDAGTNGILMCLKQNRARLSRACRGLLEAHGQ